MEQRWNGGPTRVTKSGRPAVVRARNLWASAALAAVLALLPAGLTGQTPSGSAQTPALEPGTRLRVQGQGVELSGEFIRWEADTVVLRPKSSAGYQAERAIVVTDIRELERGVRRTRVHGMERGLAWGGLIGGAVGLLVGAGAETGCFLCPESRGQALALGGGVLGGLGAVVGGLVGAIAPGTRWEPVELEERANLAEPVELEETAELAPRG